MKRLFTITLAAVLAVSLCSCCVTPLLNKKEEKPAPGTTTTAAPVEQTPTEQNTLQFDQYTLTLEVGITYRLTVSAAESATLRWQSSNEGVVLVNSEGTITAVSAGVANVTCTDASGAQAVCTVTVTAPTTTTTTAAVPQTGDVFPHSSTAYLTEEEIAARLESFSGESPTGNYAQDAINEIYARHGYVFQSDAIRAFYEAKDWYVSDSDFSFSNLNAYEKANVELLKTFK